MPAVIEMNKPLTYGGFRFFQSSYRMDVTAADDDPLGVARPRTADRLRRLQSPRRSA